MSFRIGSIQLESWALMAPMAGITNLPFRIIIKEMGAGLVTTEMVSAAGLSLGQEKTLAYLKTDEKERPLAVQIFGSESDTMVSACEIALDRGADLIDVNMGCPAKKVTKTGAGGALLLEPSRVKHVLTALRKVCHRPLTVKIRSGWSRESRSASEIAKIAQDCGCDAVTVHPRTVQQGFSGKADWGLIAEIKRSLSIPVIGNGDIFSPRLAFEMKMLTGCDAVMVGRGAIGNPWIFRQIGQLERGLEIERPGLSERKDLITRHFHLLAQFMGEARASRLMRGLLLWYTKGLPGSCKFRGAFTGIRNFPEMLNALEEYFQTLENRKIESKIG